MRKVTHAFYNGKDLLLEDFANMYATLEVPNGKFKFSSIKKKIGNFARCYSDEKSDFLDYIYSKFEDILQLQPRGLEKIMHEIGDKFSKNLLFNWEENKQTDFGAEIEELFSFNRFRQTSKAFLWAQCLNLRTCLYCNCQFTFSIVTENSKRKLMFEVDHFYPKNKYPYLSLSFYNLIPCCANCNRAKSDIDFNLKNSVHPYLEDFNNLIKFKPSNTDVLHFLIFKEERKNIKIEIDFKNNKVEKHLSTFKLKEVYNFHQDLVEEIFLKRYYYDPTTMRILSEQFKDIISEDTVKRFILGNYHRDEDINKRPLAKLTKDVAKSIGLI
ncbi:HNH endonuclease [Sphingobacterium sp. HSC-15S19]|uniref:HNH endonuclease n=1 Tax=Sphingobacterium TaxID=28453 RepID=UPI003D240D37